MKEACLIIRLINNTLYPHHEENNQNESDHPNEIEYFKGVGHNDEMNIYLILLRSIVRLDCMLNSRLFGSLFPKNQRVNIKNRIGLHAVMQS
jgi:hypothetical protein